MGEKANVHSKEQLKAMLLSDLEINYEGFWKLHVVEMVEILREYIRELERKLGGK